MNRIDVIIPVKRRPQLLRERCLPSLLHQTMQDFKVTIIDDGSDEKDFQQIQSTVEDYRNKGLYIDVHKNNGSSGAAGARNFGLECTSGEFVLWFDSDDVLLANKLELSLKLIQSGNFDLAITRAQHILHGELTNEFWGEPVAPNRGKYQFHFPFQTMCALYRRSFLQKSETRWREDISMMNDWVFSNEVLLKTDNWVYSPEITAHYFVPTSTSGSIGSLLTKKKIQSQKTALKDISKMLRSKNLNYSKVSRIRRLYQLLRISFQPAVFQAKKAM